MQQEPSPATEIHKTLGELSEDGMQKRFYGFYDYGRVLTLRSCSERTCQAERVDQTAK